MKVDNKNGIGNPYHKDTTGEFSTAEEASLSDATSNDILSGKSIGDKTFDIKKSNASFYEGIFDPNEIIKINGKTGEKITKKDYYKFEKGKDCKLVYMTGKEYLEKCAKDIFGTDYDSAVTNNAWVSQESVNAYAEAMKRGEVFPLCYLDYASHSQEGRHRALAFIKAFGENEKMPVMEIHKTNVTDEEIEDYCNRAYGGTDYWFDYVKYEKLGYKNKENPYNEEENEENEEYNELYGDDIKEFDFDDLLNLEDLESDINFDKILKELDEDDDENPYK